MCHPPELDSPQRTICQSAATAIADLSPTAYMSSTPKTTQNIITCMWLQPKKHLLILVWKRWKVGQKQHQTIETSQNNSSPWAFSLLWVQTLPSAYVTVPAMHFPTDVCISSRPTMSSQHFLLFITLDLGLCPILLQDTKPYCRENY